LACPARFGIIARQSRNASPAEFPTIRLVRPRARRLGAASFLEPSGARTFLITFVVVIRFASAEQAAAAPKKFLEDCPGSKSCGKPAGIGRHKPVSFTCPDGD
jgi:hypothetical protein